MRKESRVIVDNFRIMKLGYDFMGYDVNSEESLSFHHLIVPAKNIIVPSRELKKLNVKTDGYDYWNGVVLVKDTSHEYLHVTEIYDPNVFYDITSEMIDMKIKGRLDPKNIRLIDMRLKDFEQEYEGEIGFIDGQPIIKPEFRKRLGRVR